MLNKVRVGNDIVDLHDPQSQTQAANSRVLARVCSEEEKELVCSSSTPHKLFWTLWAIKEATYKVAQKYLHNPNFFHKQYVCQRKNDLWHCSYQNLTCEVHVEATSDFVHAIAIPIECHEMYSKVMHKSMRVQSKGDLSTEVRVMALEMLAEKGYLDMQIVRQKQQPPQIMQGGEVVEGSDLSLSHDGNYIAVAIIV